MSLLLKSVSALLVLTSVAVASPPRVKTGIEVLRQNNFDILRGKTVGLITNPTGVDSNLQSTVDILMKADGVKLAALFGPEHGVRGDSSAGEHVESSVDPVTGLPMYSLYGKTRKPTPQMLKGLDVLVYDIQDIGCRSYTYISTMGVAMEAAAEQGIEFVVLDRPNPLGGLRVEGNLVEKGFESFVSQYPIPYVYGLTCGELATLLNGEGMLAGGVRCKLTVVPMKGWTREMTFERTGLPWVPTSPHIPTADTAAYYVATGILGELTVISEGVGYTLPFKLFGAEWIDPRALAEKLNALNLDGVMFRPLAFKPYYFTFKEKDLSGVQIYIADGAKLDLMSVQFLLLEAHHQLYPKKDPFKLADESRIKMFDKVCGSDKVRKLFTRRMSYQDIKAFLHQDVESFRQRSKPYQLYQ